MRQGLVVVAHLLPGDAPHLKDVHVIGLIGQFDGQLQLVEVEVFESEEIVKNVGVQHLLAPDVNGVLRYLVGVAQSAASGCQLDL